MSRYLIFILFSCCSIFTKAQTNNNPTVSLDKMNLLYYGVDNPITIGTSVDINKAKISIVNGTFSDNIDSTKPYNRSVRPSAVGKNTKIIININGVIETFEYRVKRMPDPIFKIGSGKTRMSSVEIKNQIFCRAELENFDFDLKFEIISATVYFTGTGFPSPMVFSLMGNDITSLSDPISKSGPGTVILFDEIKVQGPDGVRTIDSKAIALY